MDPEKENGDKGVTYVFDMHEEMFKKVLSKKHIRTGIWQLIPSTCGKYVFIIPNHSFSIAKLLDSGNDTTLSLLNSIKIV